MKTEFYYPKNMWIVLGNDKERTIVKAKQETLEKAVQKNLIREYDCLRVLKVKE